MKPDLIEIALLDMFRGIKEKRFENIAIYENLKGGITIVGRVETFTISKHIIPKEIVETSPWKDHFSEKEYMAEMVGMLESGVMPPGPND